MRAYGQVSPTSAPPPRWTQHDSGGRSLAMAWPQQLMTPTGHPVTAELDDGGESASRPRLNRPGDAANYENGPAPQRGTGAISNNDLQPSKCGRRDSNPHGLATTRT
jgi:hypothetical protein